MIASSLYYGRDPAKAGEASFECTVADRRGSSHARSVARKKPAEADPDETITYDARPVVRGARLLCFVSGAALVAHHLLTGVVLTPFLGGEAFVWGNVLGSLIVSLGAGMLGGELIGRLLGGVPRAGFRVLAVAGSLIVLTAWLAPKIARAVLDRDPDAPWNPALVLSAITVLPGVLLASLVPSMIEASVTAESGSPATLSRRATRRFALAMLGGIVGLVASSWSMRHADEAHLWAQLYGLGGGLLVLSLVGLGGPGRALVVTLGAALAGVVLSAKSEIQEERFAAALSEAFVLRGAGRYYAETCPDHVLSGTELERHLAKARKRLQGADKDIAVLLVIETLKTLGPLNLSGSGLRGLLDIYLPAESKPLVLPFVDQIASVQSDGRKLHIKIKRDAEGHAHFTIPGKNGEVQEFEIIDDFDLTVLTPNDTTTKLEIGPQIVDKAGVFEFNDTIRTPFKCKRVFAWVDASLLSLTVQNGQSQVAVSASAQASISDVKTKVLQTIEKKPR